MDRQTETEKLEGREGVEPRTWSFRQGTPAVNARNGAQRINPTFVSFFFLYFFFFSFFIFISIFLSVNSLNVPVVLFAFYEVNFSHDNPKHGKFHQHEQLNIAVKFLGSRPLISIFFLVADTRLYTLPCRSVGRSVGR